MHSDILRTYGSFFYAYYHKLLDSILVCCSSELHSTCKLAILYASSRWLLPEVIVGIQYYLDKDMDFLYNTEREYLKKLK